MANDGGWFKSRLGEAIAIILSILIAFAIDAGWDTWQERKEEAELLLALRSEYEANLEAVQETMDGHRGHISDVQAVSELRTADYDTLSVNRASQMVLAFANPWTFDPSLGTTETLISSGRIGLLRDRELAAMLTTFVNFTEDAEEDADYVRSGAEFVWQAEYRLGGPWFNGEIERSTQGELEGLDFIESAGGDDLRRLWADPVIRGGALMNQINAGYYIVELRQMRDHIQAILARLPKGDPPEETENGGTDAGS